MTSSSTVYTWKMPEPISANFKNSANVSNNYMNEVGLVNDYVNESVNELVDESRTSKEKKKTKLLLYSLIILALYFIGKYFPHADSVDAFYV